MQPKIVSQKALDAYYTALADYQQHGVVNEQAITLAVGGYDAKTLHSKGGRD